MYILYQNKRVTNKTYLLTHENKKYGEYINVNKIVHILYSICTIYIHYILYTYSVYIAIANILILYENGTSTLHMKTRYNVKYDIMDIWK